LLAPEDMLRRIVREETQAQGVQNVTIRFEGTLAQFIRALKPVIDQENARVGPSLIEGVTR
jgi:hypothetical protein